MNTSNRESQTCRPGVERRRNPHLPRRGSAKAEHASHTPHKSEQGMAVIIVLAFVAIILIYLAGNARTLLWLERDLKVVEQKQIHRLAPTVGKTNSVQTSQSPGAAPAKP